MDISLTDMAALVITIMVGVVAYYLFVYSPPAAA